MNPFRYLLGSIAFSALRGYRIRGRYVGVLAGRAAGGWLASLLLKRN